MDTPIAKATRVAGGQSALARMMGVSPQADQQWNATNRIPAERVLDVEMHTGVPREELRHDLYCRKSA